MISRSLANNNYFKSLKQVNIFYMPIKGSISNIKNILLIGEVGKKSRLKIKMFL